jgi:endoglucanase
MGEFGGRSVGVDTEGVWQRSLMKFLQERGIHYTYWSLNPNSGDTGGILQDDWKTIDKAKHAVLSEYQAPLIDTPTLPPH